MKQIPLSRGKFATVDDEDYDRLSKYRWHLLQRNNETDYVVRNSRYNGKRTTIGMHRDVMGLECGDGKMVDHINRSGLDNRRSNLRLADNSLNGVNSKLCSNNTSGYRGVWWCNKWKKWKSALRVKGVRKVCGYFTDKEAAALAYDKMAIQFRGDNAILNFPKEAT